MNCENTSESVGGVHLVSKVVGKTYFTRSVFNLLNSMPLLTNNIVMMN